MMSRADKFWLPASVLRCALSKKKCVACVWLFALCACGLPGCDRVTTSRYGQLLQDAETKSAQGDFDRAINLYEAALDDSPRCAEVHYKLALLYDDKLNDPVSALHHFRRYLALSPNGAHASDVKNSIKRDELTVVTTLSGDSVVTRGEAARLRNENLTLHRELETRIGTSRRASDKSPVTEASSKKSTSKKSGGQAYVIESGDTLVSISRKFYKSPKRWKEILDANRKSIRDPKKLTVGQTLVIP
jgi:tetratricopeptide (TPR) repeat protein